MEFIKKHYSNILYGIVVVLLLYPKTRVYFLQFLSFSPSVENVENRVKLENYTWNLQGVNTTDYNFEQAKGKVVLINFWATWCTPCVAEMPSIQSLYEDYGDKVDFILVTQEEAKIVTPFMKDKGFTLPIYNALSKNPKAFETNSIPRTFLINKKGEIVIDAARADWDTKKIRKLLDGLLKE